METKLDINQIFEDAMADPSLFSTIDIEQLLDSIENTKNDYLENKTMESVTKSIFEEINELGVSNKKTQELCDKLIGYRYVDEIHELHKGKFIRWIRKTDPEKLTNGGIVVNIKFLDNGMYIVTKNGQMNRIIQFKFDECLVFQKCSVEEQLILMAYENMDNSTMK